METTYPSETFVVIYETTRRHTPEGINDCYNILIMLPSNLSSSTVLIILKLSRKVL